MNPTTDATDRDLGAATSPSTAWLSDGLETLWKLIAGKDRRRDDRFDFDVVIVGSGYGGAVAASELAGLAVGDRSLAVCILERGNEYTAGMFPSRFADAPANVRFSTPTSKSATGNRDGLFDVRLGPDLCALVGNGLGGGSLINAGVMEVPQADVFRHHWPTGANWQDELGPLYEELKTRLGATPAKRWQKTKVLESLAARQWPFRSPSITVAMEAGPNAQGVRRNACIGCGDCASGCNFDAKNSLDVSLLVEARRKGAKIYTGATVLKLRRFPVRAGKDAGANDAGGWIVSTVHTDQDLRERQRTSLRIRARHVVLAAGTLGSTEILLRSRRRTLRFSSLLGERLSANGDAIAFAHDMKVAVNAVARDRIAPDKREVGPTITGIIDVNRDRGPLEERFTVEELAVPAPLAGLFDETLTSAAALHALPAGDDAPHLRGVAGQLDPMAVDEARLCRSSVLAVMGHDGSCGSLKLNDGTHARGTGDGATRIVWPMLHSQDQAPFDRQIATLEAMVGLNPKATDNAPHERAERLIPNPMWRPLPAAMDMLVNRQRGPLLTVHPLGGCVMGDDVANGVVDQYGRVFRGASSTGADERPGPDEVHRGLYVLDGSIVPTSLGTNPALTIAALALRAVRKMIAREFAAATVQTVQTPSLRTPLPWTRPFFRQVVPDEPIITAPTCVEVIERMTGPMRIRSKAGAYHERLVELTLYFEPADVASLKSTLVRELRVRSGTLRVFAPPVVDLPAGKRWSDLGEMDDAQADFVADVRSGTLRLFDREPSTALWRGVRAFWAWLWNRGLRDGWVGHGDPTDDRSLPEWIRDAWRLAKRAGEVRLLEYDLKLTPTDRGGGTDPASEGIRAALQDRIAHDATFCGHKRLTYSRRGNPWRQMSEMRVDHFCRLPLRWRGRGPGGSVVLTLDTPFLARQGMPLLRVVSQDNEATALADLASFAMYLLRLQVYIHAWSARLPDPAPDHAIRRLPGRLPGVIDPVMHDIEVDRRGDLVVQCRLTRYRPRVPVGPPVVLMHGYSASGTTFAHPKVSGLVEHLWRRQRDVWVLDLRSSSGMPTATEPWSFEDMARADIPIAIDRIVALTGHPQVDVVAHCMGAAMFSMAVLEKPDPGVRCYTERVELQARIRRVVFSQVGPRMVFSPTNVFRTYVLRYVQQFLGARIYRMRPDDDPGIGAQMFGRLLGTLPYPQSEFDIENPLPWHRAFWKKTSFVGTRHRMDALFGRTFNVENVEPRVLDHIDDLFGPISLRTVSQTIDFAQTTYLTTVDGDNRLVTTQSLTDRFTFPLLFLIGHDNGLMDKQTAQLLTMQFEAVHPNDLPDHFEKRVMPFFGHQDSLIGRRAHKVFRQISSFLEER